MILHIEVMEQEQDTIDITAKIVGIVCGDKNELLLYMPNIY